MIRVKVSKYNIMKITIDSFYIQRLKRDEEAAADLHNSQCDSLLQEQDELGDSSGGGGRESGDRVNIHHSAGSFSR